MVRSPSLSSPSPNAAGMVVMYILNVHTPGTYYVLLVSSYAVCTVLVQGGTENIECVKSDVDEHFELRIF